MNTDLSIPPLEAGDHLTRADFERRYRSHPEIKKAELAEGIVYRPSPVYFEQHGRPHSDILTWLGVYRAATPGVLALSAGSMPAAACRNIWRSRSMKSASIGFA